MTLSQYIKICDNLVLLMHPLLEAVLHDTKTNKIAYIAGRLSNRQIGDESFLDQSELGDIDKVIYPKVNFDGKLVKSISVPLEDKWILCINCDISIFNQMQEIGKLLSITPDATKPKSLFINDWQEKVNIAIFNYLEDNNLSFNNLNSAHKQAIVKHLFTIGAFSEKNAANYIAKSLKLGRSTIFKYLKNIK